MKVALKTPLVQVEGTWEPSEAERSAAWELYVELVTRVAVVPLPNDRGLDREALNSMHALFGIHREILRRYGPAIAEPKRGGQYNLGYLAVLALNAVLRPFLSYWHPLLSDAEASNDPGLGPFARDRAWPLHDEFRTELARVRGQLRTYAQWLSHACDVPDLLSAVPGSP